MRNNTLCDEVESREGREEGGRKGANEGRRKEGRRERRRDLEEAPFFIVAGGKCVLCFLFYFFWRYPVKLVFSARDKIRYICRGWCVKEEKARS